MYERVQEKYNNWILNQSSLDLTCDLQVDRILLIIFSQGDVAPEAPGVVGAELGKRQRGITRVGRVSG